jgi:hypothetical protein
MWGQEFAFHIVQTKSGAHPASYPVDTASTLPYIFMALCLLVKYRDNFTITLCYYSSEPLKIKVILTHLFHFIDKSLLCNQALYAAYSTAGCNLESLKIINNISLLGMISALVLTNTILIEECRLLRFYAVWLL